MKYVIFVVTILLVLASYGCSTIRNKKVVDAPMEDYVLPERDVWRKYAYFDYGRLDNIQFYIDLSIDKERAKKIMVNALTVLDQFQFDIRRYARAIEVYIVDEEYLDRVDSESVVVGLYYGPRGPIIMTPGEHDTAHTLYHELLHSELVGHDVNHEDPRWEAIWLPRIDELEKKLKELDK